jgi:hypothetical protein
LHWLLIEKCASLNYSRKDMKNLKFWVLMLIVPSVLTFFGAMSQLEGANGTWFFTFALASFLSGAALLLFNKYQKA